MTWREAWACYTFMLFCFFSKSSILTHFAFWPAVDVGTGKTAKEIFGGGSHTCAILNDDTLKCWGDNSKGQLGYGDTSTRGSGSGQMGDDLPIVDFGSIVEGYYGVAIGSDGGFSKTVTRAWEALSTVSGGDPRGIIQGRELCNQIRD